MNRDFMHPVYYHDPEDDRWDAHLVTRITIQKPCECCGAGEYVYEYLPREEWYWAPMRRIVDMSDLFQLTDEKHTLYETLSRLGKTASDPSV